MFQDATRIYWALKSHVGSGRESRGLGCLLSSRHVLTAHHVYAGVGEPTALAPGGVWRCRAIAEWPDLDLGVLQTVDLLKPSDVLVPTVFPAFDGNMPGLGQSLGFLAWLTSGRHRVTYFGQGHVAFFEPRERKALRFALAGAAVQRGFSGGPVYTPAGQLVGILVECFQFAANLEHPALVSMPMFSPVAPVADELRKIISEQSGGGRLKELAPRPPE